MNNLQNETDLRAKLIQDFQRVRNFSLKIVEPLETEDFVIQPMPDASPTRWHLAHTSWFFEAFLLKEVFPNYKSIDDKYSYLFNSYYVQIGERFYRPNRGLLSRPTVKEILAYRKFVDEQVLDFLTDADEPTLQKWLVVMNIGLNHEQQHQELILTDIKNVFSNNPLFPVYNKLELKENSNLPPINWIEVEGGVREIGYNGSDFFYDNEKPVHKVYLNDFQIASRLITNGEYIEFIEDNGYSRPELWLSNGMADVESKNWKAPLYWEKIGDEWWNYTLQGFRKVEPSEPVTHVSFYEADAFSHWAGSRLATEFEWEAASSRSQLTGNFVENGNFHPSPVLNSADGIQQLYGDVWEWTRSDYAPYPGYKIPPGAIGEYNGKFMSGQIVLRGGSCATSKTHIRNTYRNFFHHNARWQFSGIRLAKDLQ
ncbi:MAG: ergothioneine biosynthesis protein EgtB [Melioribacteraceae bacterium]|nr:ergothioneine biosynthesis protein EgtB [Melioribacteraceae bacterium]MCF8412938.1 ergothioneine biosynthesis protein EgtB [Melioribacteraceae bacterium]